MTRFLALLLISCSEAPETLKSFPRIQPLEIQAEPVSKPAVWDYRLASYSTKYKFKGDLEGRAKNIELAASKLNGVVLQPGESFSFNETVGVRSEKAGFHPAPAIYLGVLEDDIGGGVCQVSSTLHAAFLSIGLQPTRRLAHSRPSAYIMAGLDATVVFPEDCESDPECYKADLEFKNTFEHPIGLRTVYSSDESDERELALFVYGPNRPQTKVEFKSTVHWTDETFEVRYRRTNKYRNDYSKKVQEGKNGRQSYLKVTSLKEVDGQWQVADVQGYQTSYPPVDEIWEVGLTYQIPGVSETSEAPSPSDSMEEDASDARRLAP